MITPAVALVAAALAAPMPTTTVIEGTVVCEPGLSGGLPKIQVVASSAIREGPQKHDAEIYVTSKTRPSRLTGIGEHWLDLSPKCVRSKAFVPLTSRGLTGGAASIFEDEYGCVTPAKVLVRVRAVFYGRVRLTLGAPFRDGVRMWYTLGDVRQGAIAVRTLTGRPIAYATISETGKARLFTGRRCT